MKIFMFLLLVSSSAFAEKNCKKEVMTHLILGSLMNMAVEGDQSCAELGQILQEESDAFGKQVSCKNPMAQVYDRISCEHPKELIDELIRDADEVPYKKICQIYLPRMNELVKKCYKGKL